MSLRQLEYVVAIAETLNFSAAARACHVTQPALSTQVQKLEAALGVSLFERDKRNVALTSAGARVVGQARDILVRVQTLRDEARGMQAPLSGTLRVGVIPTVAPYFLPRVIPVLRRDYPRLKLMLREGQTHDLVQQLRDGELDLLMLALEADLGAAETLPLFADPFVVAAPKNHALARKRTLREVDLADQEILLLEDGH